MKTINYMFVTICLLSFCTSCGPDENTNPVIKPEPPQEENTKSILGAWICEEDDYSAEAYIFYNDGTCKEWDEGNYPNGEYMGYQYNPESQQLKVTYFDYRDETYFPNGIDWSTTEEYDLYSLTNFTENGFTMNYITLYDEEIKERYVRWNNEAVANYDETILGTWIVTMDDPSWQCIVTFHDDGTVWNCISKEYYDVEGDGSFSEFSGEYKNKFHLRLINSKECAIEIQTDYKSESVMEFSGKIEYLRKDSAKFVDEEGSSLYLKKQQK